MTGFFQDFRFAVRTFIRRPAFAGVALLTLALGIGAATAIFTVVNGVLLRPFPFPEEEALAVLWNANPERGQDEYRMAGRDFFLLERATRTFEGLALVAGATASFTGPDLPPIRVEGGAVSANLFELLGVRPLMGRDFRPEENQGEHRVVILGHALWQGRFGGDPEVLGKTATIDGNAFRVVGVMPRVPLPMGGGTLRLPGPELPAYWTPLDYTLSWVAEIDAHVMAVVGRLAPGVTLEQAREEMTALARSMEEGRGGSSQRILVRSLREQVVGDIRHTLVILQGAVGLLLLMACGNLANLLLARASEREREAAVRTALGAGRSRILRQIFTEVLLLGCVGGTLGLGLALWGTGALLSLAPSSLPRQSEIGVDPSVLLFTLSTVLFSTLLAGLAPSLQLSHRDPEGRLRGGGRWATHGRKRKRANRLIVGLQFGLATVLLFGAGLLLRTVHSLRAVDPGFRSEGVLTAQIVLPNTRYGEPDRILSFYRELKEKVEALPGVREAVFGMDHPLESSWWNGVRLLDRPPPTEADRPIGFFRPVSQGYFRLHGIPLVAGRAFDAADAMDQPGVMIVNQAFVRRFIPDGNPLGERVEFVVGQAVWGPEAPTEFEIVGVVGDVRFNGFREPAAPAFHVPLSQFPYGAVKLQIGTEGDPENLAGPVMATVWTIDPDLPLTDVRTMDHIVAEAVAQDRFNATLLSAFAAVALILAAAGVFGVLSYTVAQRKAELGIRMALGADSGEVLRMVVRDGTMMAGMGMAGGLVAALALSPILASLLFGVPAHDPPVAVGVGLVLGLSALAAGFLPGLRASRTDPMEALKAD